MRSFLAWGRWVMAVAASAVVLAGVPIASAQEVNQPPVAVHDVAEVTVGPGAGVTVDVRANDFDPDGGPLLVVAVGQASNGLTTINSRGQPNYTPNPGFVGLDSFTYTVADGEGGSATSTVFVAVSSAEPTCSFSRGTTTCTTVQRDLQQSERTVTSGCVAGPPPGVPGVHRQVFVESDLITTTTVVLSRGQRGPVYDRSTTTTTERILSQVVSSTCEPI